MKASEIRRKYIDFFVEKCGHAEIPSASLIPENDPTVLFTTAGMHPLVPYLLGQAHPKGRRLVDVQKCVRTDDIDEVGDNTHLTFFEMLGNWSLGDYFKKESINWSYQLLTEVFGLDPKKICVTCYEGDDQVPKDEEAAGYWEELGFVRAENAGDNPMRIFFFGKKENWWGPAGQTGPCGPDTEIFYYCGPEGEELQHAPNDENDYYVEIWNNVFMQYNKDESGNFTELEQMNVDTGLGLERLTAIMQGKQSHFETELFSGIIDYLKENGSEEIEESFRVISDHIRAAAFILGDPRGVTPSNTDQGYVLRRLIRRAIRHGRKIGLEGEFTVDLAKTVIATYSDFYTELKQNEEKILTELEREEKQFAETLQNGEKEFNKMLHIMKEHGGKVSGRMAFKLYDTYGFPLEMTQELASEYELEVDVDGFHEAFKKHQEKSRAGAEQKFKGGLADDSEATTNLHTAHHLLLKALQIVLGDHVKQRGSNITAERLRIDFNHEEKMTDEQKQEVEDMVNEKIKEDLPVRRFEMKQDDAANIGAEMEFGQKYPDVVTVYFMGGIETGDESNPVEGWFSAEFCGGPHAENTGKLGAFKIKKEQSSSRGVRRIKAVLS
jgi:alanyl-tRNA synthetase